MSYTTNGMMMDRRHACGHLLSLLLLLLLLYQFNVCQAYLSDAGGDTSSSTTIKCKYVFISKSFYGNSLSSQSLAKIIKMTKKSGVIATGRPELLNPAYFKFYEDDCLNERRVDQIIQQQSDNDPFILFGVDLSYQQLNDSTLEQLLYSNPVLKYNINLVKYLDLRGNRLRWLNSSLSLNARASRLSSASMSSDHDEQLLDEELSYMNDVQLKSDETFYLLNRFFNLEILALDENELLSVDVSNAVRIFQKLKVLSLSRCGGGGGRLLDDDSTVIKRSNNLNHHHHHQLYYLSLAQNGLTETQINRILGSLGGGGGSMVINNLDLSENRIKIIEHLVFSQVNRLNLDKNLISVFNVKNMVNKMQPATLTQMTELSLRFNSIKDTSIDNFKLTSSSGHTSSLLKNLRVNLEGNPLVCDCKSHWLLDLVQTFQRSEVDEEKEAASSSQSDGKQQPATYLSRKKSSSKQQQQQQQASPIKLVFKRDVTLWQPVDLNTNDENSNNYEIKADAATTLNDNTEFVNMNKHNHQPPHRRFRRAKEEISPHFSLESDPNLPPRQKRIKTKVVTTTTSSNNEESIIQIADLDQLTCLFIDVQGFDSDHRKQSLNNESTTTTSEEEAAFDMSEVVDYVIVDESSNDQQPLLQNINANIRYLVEKKVTASQYSDYMCQYADHCEASGCDCCAFMHCHCRSICPAECRCYYDSRRGQNIIDCSGKQLTDMPSTENPIESATDIRLDRNEMPSVKAHTFFGYGQVKYLYLQANGIERVEHEAFEDLRLTLRLVNLANNRLSFLDVWAEFASFNELQVLVLSGNPLLSISSSSSLSQLQYVSLPKLRVIYASKTNLSENYLSQLLVKQPFNMLNLKYKVKSTTTTTFTTSTIETTTQVSSTSSRPTRPSSRNSTRRSSPKTSSRLYMTNWWLYTTTTTPSTSSQRSFTVSSSQERGSILSTLMITTTTTRGGFQFPTQKQLVHYYHYIIVGVIAFALVASSICLILMICRLRKRSGSSNNKPPLSNASVYYMEPAEIDEDDTDEEDHDDDDDDGSEEAIERRNCKKKRRYDTNNGGGILATLFKAKNVSSVNSTYTNIKRNGIYGGVSGGASALRHHNHHRPSLSGSSYASVVDDAATTVPVSRSLDHLTLNVFVHFHLNDNQYIVDYLLPCLKSCCSLVPETRYILKVQTDKYMDTFDYTMVLNQSNNNNTQQHHQQNGPDLVIIDSKKCSNSLVANLFVLSSHFEGYRPAHLSSSSLTSSRISATTNSTRSTNDNSSGVVGVVSNTNFSTRRGGAAAFNPALAYKNAFKIHLFKLTPSMLRVERQMATMNRQLAVEQQKSTSFLKKLYNTAGLCKNTNNTMMNNHSSSSSSSSTTAADQNPYLSINSVNNSNLPLLSSNHHNQPIIHQTNYCLFAPNDLHNAYAYHEQLQHKIERYLEHVCLKSSQFSKSNFSYVDYTSKR